METHRSQSGRVESSENEVVPSEVASAVAKFNTALDAGIRRRRDVPEEPFPETIFELRNV